MARPESCSLEAVPSKKSAKSWSGDVELFGFWLVYSPLKLKMPLDRCELLKLVCSQNSCNPNLSVWEPRVHVTSAATSRFSDSSMFGTLLTPRVAKFVIDIWENPGYTVSTPGMPTEVRL